MFFSVYKVPSYIYIIYLFVPLLASNLIVNTEQHFVYLADSFLKGQLDLNAFRFTAANLSHFRGDAFWPNGPFPAVILMPFVAVVGILFIQGIVQFPLNVLNFILIQKISKLLGVKSEVAIFLAIFFIFGSVYTPVAVLPISWYFAQVVATSALLLALYDFLTKRRYLLLGVLIGITTLTRFTLILSSVFFLIHIAAGKQKLLNLAKFSVPILASVLIMFSYNFARFGNILESGYKYQHIVDELPKRNEGLFSLKHFSSNFYHMLFKPPTFVVDSNDKIIFPFIRFDNYGMSILIFSPILLLLYRANFRDFLVKTSAITAVVMLVPILTYYGSGLLQVGYRYAVDIFPFVLILLASALRKFTKIQITSLTFLGVLITWFFIFEKLSGY